MEDIDKQIIYGDIVSKPNCYKIITINGHGSLAKQPKLKEYEKTFYLQCNKYRDKNITGLFEAYIDCYLPSNRQFFSLDGSFVFSTELPYMDKSLNLS